MLYRSEIDGLRALAVLPIVFFHAGFSTFSGGFVGVDIFFVISGYLITTIIYEESQQNKFNLINFYERRARRILPLLFIVVAATVPFAWLIMSPFDLISYSKSFASIPLFLSNIFFWKDGGYFDTASELKPLLHTWSLAVEEQFYLIFPIFFIIAWKYCKNHIEKIILIILLLSILIAQISTFKWPAAAFFLLPTRMWELCIGCLTAIYLIKNRKLTINIYYRNIISLLGISLILISIFIFNKDSAFPSLIALYPTIGTALIILFAQSDTIVGRFLSKKFIVFIGLISFSLYLWHQPIFALYRYHFYEIDRLTTIFLLIIILFLSIISWKYVEVFFRNRSIINRKNIFRLSVVFIFLYVSFGLYSIKVFESPNIRGGEVDLAKLLINNVAVYSSNMDERKFIASRIRFENLNPNVLVLGSSRTMQLGIQSGNNGFLNLSISGASLKDTVNIATLATQKFKPQTILIAADPWLLNSQTVHNLWNQLSIGSNLLSINNILNISTNDNSLSETSKNSFIDAGVNIYNEFNKQKITSSNNKPENRDKILRDGSRVYNTSYRNMSAEQIDIGFSNALSYEMNPFDFSNENFVTLEKLLTSYSHKFKVVLILSPYHPKLYERMIREKEIFLNIEDQFRKLAMRNNIEIIGSYDPDSVGCKQSEFFDGMHPKGSCMEKVINELNNPRK